MANITDKINRLFSDSFYDGTSMYDNLPYHANTKYVNKEQVRLFSQNLYKTYHYSFQEEGKVIQTQEEKLLKILAQHKKEIMIEPNEEKECSDLEDIQET